MPDPAVQCRGPRTLHSRQRCGGVQASSMTDRTLPRPFTTAPSACGAADSMYWPTCHALACSLWGMCDSLGVDVVRLIARISIQRVASLLRVKGTGVGAVSKTHGFCACLMGNLVSVGKSPGIRRLASYPAGGAPGSDHQHGNHLCLYHKGLYSP